MLPFAAQQRSSTTREFKMTPTLFIASASESLDVAYAIQEELEEFAEATVWQQHLWEPTRTTLEDLISALDQFDFGAFVFTPDDISIIREQEQSSTRDNVIFELGLFVGRLGRERNFIIMPKTAFKHRLPTDLLGVTTLSYTADRKDRNLRAALGPACNQIRKAIRAHASAVPKKQQETRNLDRQDIISIVESWFISRPRSENCKVITFSEVDQILGIPAGSAKMHLPEIAPRRGYSIVRQGENTLLLGLRPRPPRVIARGGFVRDY